MLVQTTTIYDSAVRDADEKSDDTYKTSIKEPQILS
jgi:hypothetical protein